MRALSLTLVWRWTEEECPHEEEGVVPEGGQGKEGVGQERAGEERSVKRKVEEGG